MNSNNDPIYDTSSDEDDWSDYEEEEPEEPEEDLNDICTNTNNRKLVVCELHNVLLHGGIHGDGHFLMFDAFPNLKSRALNQALTIISKYNRKLVRDNSPKLHHKTLRNYEHIIETNAFNQPQIATCLRLPSGEMVAIIKTVYLRIFQRIWKKYYKKLMANVKKRMTLEHINASRLRWPIPFK
jgi:hypothetical protein